MSNMRAKMRITSIELQGGGNETLHFMAVCKSNGYEGDGLDENNTYAKFSPNAKLDITIANPDLQGKFSVDEEYYIDFTKAS